MSRPATADTHPASLARAIGMTLSAGLCTIALGTVAQAEDRHVAFAVGATVQGAARVVNTGSPDRLVIDVDDLAAGYVEVRPTGVLKIDSNSRVGVAIEIRSRHPAFADVEVRYGGGIARLDGDALRLVQRGQPNATLPLAYRFILPQGLPAGSYAWPLEIRASTL